MYSFICRSKRHENESTRKFVQSIHLKDVNKRVDQIQCPECGGLARRDLVADLQTVSTVGSTPISHASSGKGTLAHATQFAFGRFKENPDGSVDRNHTRFSTTGELEKYVNGRNELGPPKLDDRGRRIMRPDGSFVREGKKLVKFDNNRRPPVNKRPVVTVPSAWVGDDVVAKAGPTPRATRLPGSD